jgi:hypothetical protein
MELGSVRALPRKQTFIARRVLEKPARTISMTHLAILPTFVTVAHEKVRPVQAAVRGSVSIATRTKSLFSKSPKLLVLNLQAYSVALRRPPQLF